MMLRARSRILPLLVLLAGSAALAVSCPAGTPLLRLTEPAYEDGLSAPRSEANSLPGARLISNIVCSQPESYQGAAGFQRRFYRIIQR